MATHASPQALHSQDAGDFDDTKQTCCNPTTASRKPA
jgi:hypothetical protein